MESREYGGGRRKKRKKMRKGNKGKDHEYVETGR